jgi:tetratricopeptide (TPR) repeat protein
MEIAGLYIEIGSFDKAILELQKAELNVKETAQSPKLARIYEQFMLIYKKTGNFPEALDYSEKLLAINEEINRQEMETRISILNTSFQKEKEDEIERLRTVELKKAYELIDQKNKDITDSIKYAKRIQQAILPSEKYIQKSLERLSGKQL